MKRYLLIGTLLFVGFALANAPASLATRAITNLQSNANPPISLLRPSGTLWAGAGELSAAGQTLGKLHWQLQPLGLVTGALKGRYQLALRSDAGDSNQLRGEVAAGFTRIKADVAGQLSGGYISQWLNNYEVNVGGTFTSDNLTLTLDPNEVWPTLMASGDVLWSGGQVSYREGNRIARQVLQPLTAMVSSNRNDTQGLQAEIFGEESYPLLQVVLMPNGFAKVSITRRLTEIVGSPWPGSDPGHAIVLEVEQSVF